ncbi:MAG TPA: hypothetical protein VKQ28_16815 [Candidatus Acidoferrum sp.]|nr:hypothetical protein [Candidatus Acidoferrum sp.]
MAHQFDQFQAQRDVALRDAAGKLPAGSRDALLTQAILQRYSQDRPREVVSDIPGNGTNLLPLPGAGTDVWEEGYSSVRTIEFPIGTFPPNLILEEDWQIYGTPSGKKIMVISTAPLATDTVRITWTARHLGDGSTVPDPDFEAVCDYAAGLCYEALAGIYAQTGDASISADSVNYRTKSQEYMGLAKAAKKRYFDHVGVDDSKGVEVGPAIATGSMHENLIGGFDRMTHRKASR